MCGIVKSVFKAVGLGADSPPVVHQSPAAVAVAADAAAAGAAAQDRTRRRRAVRSSSLLATGADGDLSNPVSGAPSATGKSSLGA